MGGFTKFVCACARSIAKHAPNTTAHPAMMHFDSATRSKLTVFIEISFRETVYKS
jgi:hypothetical protein